MSKTILYARVSTAEQTLKHQRDQAEQAGFVIDEVIEDEGTSGVQIPLAERPNGKRLFDILRNGDVLAVRWIDRLGRNYYDIQTNIRLFLDGVCCVCCVRFLNIMLRVGSGCRPIFESNDQS